MSRLSNLVRIAGSLGGYSCARIICRRQPRVLMYHRFSEEPKLGFASAQAFEKQVKYIKKHYNPMTMAELSTAMFVDGRIPPHAVVLTVDDGYRDFYDVAYPILRRHNVPATFFATSGFVDDRLWLWPDRVAWLLNTAETIECAFTIKDLTFGVGPLDPTSRLAYWRALVEYLLSVDDEEKNGQISVLAERLGIRLPLSAPEGYESVSWDQLRELSQAGIEVGGHTVTHPSLGRVTRTQAEEEIYGCMSELESNLGGAPRTFCYPNGTPSDFQNFLPDIIADAGFVAAAVAFPDARGAFERFAVRRHVGGDAMFQFYKSVSGVELLGQKLRRITLMPALPSRAAN